MTTPTHTRTAAVHLARAEEILDRIDAAVAADLPGAAWYASIATAHLLAAAVIELGTPSGAVHQPGTPPPAGPPAARPAASQAGP